jgi:hypothetical protein
MEQYLKICNNYFEVSAEQGTYTVSCAGEITVKGKYAKGQYIRVMGSLVNDDVYEIVNLYDDKIVVRGNQQETFDGIIVGLAIPKSFKDLAAEIKLYQDKHPDTGILSESIPNYSVSYKDGGFLSVFASELAPYKKLPPPTPYDFMRRVKIYE